MHGLINGDFGLCSWESYYTCIQVVHLLRVAIYYAKGLKCHSGVGHMPPMSPTAV